MVLQLLVRKIDAELLEAVDLENLEPENIEHADAVYQLASLDSSNALVDQVCNVIEELAVQCFGQAIARILGLLMVVVGDSDLTASLDLTSDQSLFTRLRVHSEKVGRERHVIRIGNLHCLIPTPLESGVSKMHHSRNDTEHRNRIRVANAETFKRIEHQAELLWIINSLHSAASPLLQEVVIIGRGELHLCPPVCRQVEYLEKYVVVAFPVLLEHDPRLFEQVFLDVAVYNLSVGTEVQVHVLAEARGIIVPHSLGVAK